MTGADGTPRVRNASKAVTCWPLLPAASPVQSGPTIWVSEVPSCAPCTVSIPLFMQGCKEPCRASPRGVVRPMLAMANACGHEQRLLCSSREQQDDAPLHGSRACQRMCAHTVSHSQQSDSAARRRSTATMPTNTQARLHRGTEHGSTKPGQHRRGQHLQTLASIVRQA